MDRWIFLRLNAPAPEWWGDLLYFLSEGNKMDSVRIGLLLFAVVCLIYPKTRKATFIALLAWPLANGFAEALKYGFMMPRPSHPEFGFAEAIVRVDRLTSFGTASAHAANMAAVAGAYLLAFRPLGYAWAVVAVLTGISRIYVGVHYPYQVLLGWIVGLFCALLMYKMWEAVVHLRGRKREAATEPAEDPSG